MPTQHGRRVLVIGEFMKAQDMALKYLNEYPISTN
jgi:hypothetical protein